MHPIAPVRPALVFVVAEDGAGKTTLLTNVAANAIKAGKKVLYIYNEGDPKTDIAPLIKVAGGNPGSDLLVLLDSEVEHYVPLEGMSENAAVKPHLPGVDILIIDTLSGCEAETIRRNTIHQRLKQFKKLVREGVTVFIAVHPNRLRTVRRPTDLVPAGWGAKVQVIWMIEPTDDKGHYVLEMIRSKFDEKPWTRYPFWVSNVDGVKLAVIDVDKKNTGPTIAELLEEKNPTQLSKAMADAKAWLLAYLAKHGPRLAETEVFPDGKVRGHSEATLTRVKAITPEIGHTPQGKGPSKWFLKADEQTQQTQQDKRDDRIRKLETLRDDPSAPPGEVAAARAALARMFENTESVEPVESVSDERTQQSQPPEAAKSAEPGQPAASKFAAKRASLFRYPGGKYKQAPFYSSIIGTCETINEPFAGGAHVTVFALLNGVAKRARINDIDPGVSAFWKVLFEGSDADYRLLRTLIDRKPGLDEFLRRKEDVKCDDRSIVERAFHAFYLNKTTYSGLITSGPMGGEAQDKSTIDERYNATRFLEEMDRLRVFKGRVVVTCEDFAECIAHAAPGDFIDADPPYMGAGDMLYTQPHQHMRAEHHERLAAALRDADARGVRFMCSYDDHPKVRAIYNGFHVFDQPMLYSIDGKRTSNKTKNELLITNFDSPQLSAKAVEADTSWLTLVTD